MTRMHPAARFLMGTVAALPLAGCVTAPQQHAASYEGSAVALGNGTARTIVRTNTSGQPDAIAVVFTESALEGLPAGGAPGAHPPDFAYVLPMPERGPRTVVDHVMINWNPQGHPPAGIYGVPHFDFHFYLVSSADREKVQYQDESESGHPSQQPAAEFLPLGYIIPPGTAVPKMGVHAINLKAPEFNGRPFEATFIYGFHQKQQTFLEPMVTLAYLKSKPAFAAPVERPTKFLKAGTYPSSYSVRYEVGSRQYEVSLDGLR